ncbi:FkbM family methyltransferase [Microcoleus vaginatus GB1-A2]|uniref:FkbM family methyltransferase n=1 Tax=Microcoleus vaginatus TaxID=119532 RepID=UPI0016898615|nr:FkbM family methyltransferase [Microcoleus sp. FACHB-61]
MTNNEIPRSSMFGSLWNAKQLGFEPETVIDVGAGLGTFEIYEAFPKSKYLLIEPIAENEPYLKKICQYLERADYIIAAASKEAGLVPLQVNLSNFIHSYISEEDEASSENFELRTIPAVTLDKVCKTRQLEGPYLIKVDVDGRELDVLAGATQILQNTELVIVEVTLYVLARFDKMWAVINFMKEQGFVAYDIVGLSYRLSDLALSQVDMVFVKESGQFTKESRYVAGKEQEERLRVHLKAYRENFMAHVENLMPFEVLQKTGLIQAETIQQQAYQNFIQGDYSGAANLYEQAIEAEPDNRSHYWYLGLALLLAGQEIEAQATWLIGMTGGDSEQVELWTKDLIQVLQTEAERRGKVGDYGITWTIRHHLREISPTDINNLLHLINLSILMGSYTEADLDSLGVIKLVKSDQSSEVDSGLLLLVVKNVLEYNLLHPLSRELYEQAGTRLFGASPPQDTLKREN